MREHEVFTEKPVGETWHFNLSFCSSLCQGINAQTYARSLTFDVAVQTQDKQNGNMESSASLTA